MTKPILTQDILKDKLLYDEHTGIFTWLKSDTKRIKTGSIAGFTDVRGYVSIHISKKLYYAHRLAWLYKYGNMPKQNIDHINGNRNDNRIENLREASQQQNVMNVGARKRNTSGYKGVSFSKVANKWEARFTYNKKTNYLGLFLTAELARDAYILEINKLNDKFIRVD